MRKTFISFAAIALAFGHLAAAKAQSSEPPTGQAEFYARAGIGVTFPSNLEQDVTLLRTDVAFPAVCGAGPLNALETEFGASPTFAVAAGRAHTNGIRAELEYRYSAVQVDRLIGTGTCNVKTDLPSHDRVDVHTVIPNLYFDFNQEGRISPFVGVGVGGAFIGQLFESDYSNLAFQGRAGIAFTLAEGLSLDVEYIHLRTTELENDVGDLIRVRLNDGSYISSDVSVSLRKRF